MILRRLVAIALFVASYCTSYAQITAEEAITAMGRGINLGNTLDAPEYEGQLYWADPALEYYFEMYKEAGFKTVRIPITWNAALSESNSTPRIARTAPYTIEPEFFDRLDTIIKWSLERDMYTIINVHHDGWVKDASTFDDNKDRLFALWTQVADHYKDYSEKLFFEILNEPHSDNSLTTTQVNEVNSECLDIIRVNNPTRIVVYMGPNYSSSSDLRSVAVPNTNDDYLMGSYHSYDPWPFAGEAKGTWGSAKDMQDMTDQMEGIKEWGDQNNIPIFIGELGAMNSCDYNSRMRYYAHYIQEAMRIGLAFTVWDDDGWFQTLERNDTSWNDAKDIIIYTTEQSPTDVVSDVQKGDDTTIVVNWTNRAVDCDSVFIQKRLNNSEFVTVEKYTDNTSSYTDTDFEEKNYYYYRIIARYNDSIDVYSYPTRVFVTPTKRAPFHGTPIAIPGTIEAEDFDEGGQGLTYNETTAVNQGDAPNYRPGEVVDIEVREEGGYQVGFVEKGEWLEYTVDIEEAGDYTVNSVTATQLGSCVMGLDLNGESIANINIPNTGSWQTTEETKTNITFETTGEHILRINIISDNAFNIDKLVLTKGHTSSNVTSENNSFNLYPNPVQNTLFIDASGMDNNARLEIINMSGNVVLISTIENAINGLSITELDNGFYFARISNQNQTVTKKFIKH